MIKTKHSINKPNYRVLKTIQKPSIAFKHGVRKEAKATIKNTPKQVRHYSLIKTKNSKTAKTNQLSNYYNDA